MKNANPKPMQVVLLDADGQPEPNGFGGRHMVAEQGAAGFRVQGGLRMFLWTDKGKTWLPVEEAK